MRFSSLVLPPARVKHQARPYLPGIYWPHAEDPREVPWRPTHRIHFIGPDRQPGTAEVMWVLDQDVAWSPDMVLRSRRWYGYEREQWVPGGRTGWVFSRDQEYAGTPHVLRRTDAWQGDHRSLEMERIGEALVDRAW